MSFIETPRFPSDIRYGSTGGPMYKTDLVVLDSGAEQRNQKWAYPRYAVNANAIEKQSDLETLIAFFHICAGRANGFRFKDWYDFKSCAMADSIAFTDQNIGTGDGAETDFQLRKAYVQGSNTQYRKISKPVSGTTVAGISGVQDTDEGTTWSVDTTTGIVTFVSIQKTVSTASDQGGGITRIQFSALHGLNTGATMYFSTFTGDWAGLNSTRFQVTVISGDTIDITHDSSAYALYSSNGGQGDTLPQASEAVTAGFEFDIPMRFDTDALSTSWEAYQLGEIDVPLVEIKL